MTDHRSARVANDRGPTWVSRIASRDSRESSDSLLRLLYECFGSLTRRPWHLFSCQTRCLAALLSPLLVLLVCLACALCVGSAEPRTALRCALLQSTPVATDLRCPLPPPIHHPAVSELTMNIIPRPRTTTASRECS